MTSYVEHLSDHTIECAVDCSGLDAVVLLICSSAVL